MDNDKPTISVVVPCFNAGKNLAITLDSILQQTLVPDEIVVIDDGSDDDSTGIALEYGEPVILIKQSNQGAAVARHLGAQKTTKDIVIFVDAGDRCPPEKIETLITALIANPRCICAFGESWNRAKGSPELARFTRKPLDGSYTVIEDPFKVMLGQTYPLASAMNIAVYRKFAVMGSDIGSFFKAGNDHALQLNLARFGPFVHVAFITQEFEIYSGGLSDKYGSKLQMTYSLLAASQIFERLSEKDKEKYVVPYRNKVSQLWPVIVLFLWKTSNIKLLKKVAKLIFCDGYVFLSLKSIYWSMVQANKSVGHSE